MSPDLPRQLPLDFQHVAGFARDDLVVSPANADAVETIERWPDWASPVTLLVGPAGSGKSHLGAIWRELSDAMQVPSKDMAESVDLRPWPPILVDDADGPGLDESGLFHVLNAAREARGHVLLTARTLPSNWSVKLPDLLSRLNAATVVRISEPDDFLLGGVIVKLFADRQVEIDAALVQYLVRRMERSLAQASELVDRLDRLALERKSRITRALAAELFGRDGDEHD